MDAVTLAKTCEELGAGEGVRGGALRLDFRFEGGGYAVARKEFALDLPPNYVFSFQLRGTSPPNHLEFKLIDDTGEPDTTHGSPPK